jgi:hypothetical protein
MRATHLAFLNDAAEYLHAVSLLLERVRAELARTTTPLQRKLLEEMEKSISGTRAEHAAPYFITCFSAEENSLIGHCSYLAGQWPHGRNSSAASMLGSNKRAQSSRVEVGLAIARLLPDMGLIVGMFREGEIGPRVCADACGLHCGIEGVAHPRH